MCPDKWDLENIVKEQRDFFQILSLCLRSRCPVCAQGHLFVPFMSLDNFSHFFLPPKHCDSCHFQFARGSGYFLGVITPTLPILSLGVGILFAAVSYFFFHLPVNEVLIWGLVGVSLGCVFLFRTSIAIYVALDHAIDPPG